MKSKIFLLSFIFILLLLCSSSPQSVQGRLAPALYVFGDSLFDVGNNNGLNTTAFGKYLPYGIDFVTGPSGRFTNGRLIVDFFAEFLGLPYAPPYLGLSEEEKHTVTTGVNYASAGAGILPESTYTAGDVVSLPRQIDCFAKTVGYLRSTFRDEQALNDYLAESIFVISVGGNDYSNNYLRPADYESSRRYASREYAALLVDHFSLLLQRLYNLGARKIIVLEIQPLGCVPFYTDSRILSNVCDEEINRLVAEFNNHLLARVEELNSTLSGSIFSYGNFYTPFYHLYHNPTSYGFGSSDKHMPCCYLVKGSQCLPGHPPCPLRDERVYWDAFHTTEAVYQILSVGCFNQSNSLCTPNLEQLTQLKANAISSHLDLDIQRLSRAERS